MWREKDADKSYHGYEGGDKSGEKLWVKRNVKRVCQ